MFLGGDPMPATHRLSKSRSSQGEWPVDDPLQALVTGHFYSSGGMGLFSFSKTRKKMEMLS